MVDSSILVLLTLRTSLKLFREMVDFPVLEPLSSEEALEMYRYAKDSEGPVMIVEHKSYH